MLSILIPTYNYDVCDLVEKLHVQAQKVGVEYEVLVFDDASTQPVSENERVSELENCTYKILEKNIGRSAIRNLLAREARYQNLLFLDADVAVISDDFIANYVNFMKLSPDFLVVYGGIVYQTNQPSAEQLLRWKYGREREALRATQRNLTPNLSFLTLNFLIKKAVFKQVIFNEEIPNVRYEDVLFSYDLMQKGIIPKHIDNPVEHLGIETSEIFLRKTEESLEGLLFLLEKELLPYTYIKISRVYFRLKRLHLTAFGSVFYKLFSSMLRKKLLGQNPDLKLFDIYRLMFLCKNE